MPYAYVQRLGGKGFYFRTDTGTSRTCRDGSDFDTEVWFWGGEE